MPPPLALIVCTLFVLYILRYDRRDPNNVSGVLWIPTIWLFSIATKSLSAWIGGGGADVEAGNSIDRVFVTALLFLGLLVLTKRQLDWPSTINGNIALAVLIGYMLVSIVWSDIPFVSLKRWIRELTAVIMALVVLTERSPRQALQILFRRTVYILIPFSLLLIKYFPMYGVQFSRWSGERMWVGVTTQKNSLGRLCIISAFFLIWTLLRRWQGRDIKIDKYQTHAEVFLLLLTLYLLKGPPNAYPATAIAVLVIGLATHCFFVWMKKRGAYISVNALTLIIGSIIVLGVVTPFVGGSSVSSFTSMLGRDSTLTGRTEIWAALLPLAEREFLLGSGFGAFWTSKTTGHHHVNEAHNGYLDVFLQLGFVGVILTALFLLSFGRKAQRTLRYDFDWGSLCICYLLMTLLHNITESSIDSFTRHLMATVLFLSVSLSSPRLARLYNRRRHREATHVLVEANLRRSVAI